MSKILILEDEPLILIDLEYAAEDRDYTVVSAANCEEALSHIASAVDIDVAILDVSLAQGCNCVPVARELSARGIPFLLHSGDLDRHQEPVRNLDAPLIAKPAAAEKVIAAAIALSESNGSGDHKLAAE